MGTSEREARARAPQPVVRRGASALGPDDQHTSAGIIAEEGELVARVQRGDTDAFEALVGRYVQRAHAIARRLMGDSVDAEDLMQDAFLRALERIGTFDPRRAFGPWFFRLLVNTGLDTHRKRSVRRTEPEDVDAPSTAPTPLQRLEREEVRRRFEAALEALPPRQRLIIWAYDVDGMSTGEIAESIGISQVTVRTHLHHGRHALREALGVVKD